MAPGHDLHFRQQMAQMLGVAAETSAGHSHRSGGNGEGGPADDVARHRLPRRAEQLEIGRDAAGAQRGVHPILIGELPGPGPQLVQGFLRPAVALLRLT